MSDAPTLSSNESHRRRLFGALALLLLVGLTFGRIATHEFVNLDDNKFLYENADFLPPTGQGLSHVWQRPFADLYVPVAMTFWWLIAHIGLVDDGRGAATMNPWVFHAASLLVHAASVLLVQQLLRQLTRDDWAALLGAAIFAVHPIQTETIAWASEMKDLLAALFSLVSLIALLSVTATTSIIQSPDSRSPKSLPRWLWRCVAAACFAAALLSKPSAVTLPLVAGVLLWIAGVRLRRCALIVIFGLILALPVAFITHHVQSAAAMPSTRLLIRPLVAADALAFYLMKVVWPIGLSPDYGRSPASIIASSAIAWTWIIPIGVTIVLILFRRRFLLGAWLIFVIAASANLGLLPFDFQISSTVADHYLYFSFLGVAIAIAWLVHALPRLRYAIASVVILLAVAAFVQAGYWRDAYTLWHRTLTVNDQSALAWDNLGTQMLADHNAAGAVDALMHATRADPTDPFAFLNLTRARLATSDFAGAAASALEMVSTYQQRRDFNPQLAAAFLERVAQAEAPHDPSAANRLLDCAKALQNMPSGLNRHPAID